MQAWGIVGREIGLACARFRGRLSEARLSGLSGVEIPAGWQDPCRSSARRATPSTGPAQSRVSTRALMCRESGEPDALRADRLRKNTFDGSCRCLKHAHRQGVSRKWRGGCRARGSTKKHTVRDGCSVQHVATTRVGSLRNTRSGTTVLSNTWPHQDRLSRREGDALVLVRVEGSDA